MASSILSWLKYFDPTNNDVLRWYAAIVAVFSGIAQGVIPLPTDIPVHLQESIKQWDSFIVAIWLVVLPYILKEKQPTAGVKP